MAFSMGDIGYLGFLFDLSFGIGLVVMASWTGFTAYSGVGMPLLLAG